MDKYFFDGGYALAKTNEATLADSFSFHYYTADHLGRSAPHKGDAFITKWRKNIREVINEYGAVEQITNYYPFGTPFAEEAGNTNPDLQNHKYNGKEYDTMHGLNTYDYGARQYNSLLGRWDRIDPLCEKYYSVSPYAYCANNPILLIDPDGCDWYYNTNNVLLWNPLVHSQKDLQDGYKYVGTTYNDKKNGIQYRDDGTVLCPNESSGIARMKLQQEVSQSSKNIHGKEQSACLLDDKNGSMLVFPDNWNNGHESKIPAGYKLTSEKLTNSKGEKFSVAAHIHSHPGAKSDAFSNEDAGFAISRPNLPMFVLHADGNIYYGVGTSNEKFVYGTIPRRRYSLLHYSKEIRRTIK